MQSLALDIQVMSEEGGTLEVAEEEDDLLRAAEELGIDLSARYRAEERAAEAEATLVPTHTGSELDEGFDEEEEPDEFEGAPELETFEIDMEGEVGVELPSLAEEE
jgi:DNA-directed RNA polymerase subunit beta